MKSQIATLRIAEQLDSYGFFGEIELEFIVCKNDSPTTIHIDQVFNRWKAGVEFGVSYFIEHCKKQISLNVIVRKIESFPVDTTNTIIAFLTFNALLSSTDFGTSGKMEFIKNEKSFLIRK